MTDSIGRSRFDSDTNALRVREGVNARGSERNLEDWLLEGLPAPSGRRVLDLGCGTGKQVFVLAGLVAPHGSVLGYDIAPEAVEQVNRLARERHLPHVRAVQGSLDQCTSVLADRTFDLILSVYAIYYAKDMLRVLRDLRTLLAPDGTTLVCGPGDGTNAEMAALVNDVSAGRTPHAAPVGDFISAPQVSAIHDTYAYVDVRRLNNRVVFESADAVLGWWRNHSSYVPALDAEIAREVEKRIHRDGRLALTKNVLALQMRPC